jgi:4-hydroxy-4-methyl-2-oxoglutarate aldolase
MSRARRTLERPSAELVSAVGSYATTQLSDALGRTGAMHARLRPVGTNARMAGSAVTVRLYANDNLMCHVGVMLAQAGDVLVIDANGYVEAGVWGEMLTRAALARGIAGVVIDGAARDSASITELGFPVFAAAIVPRGTHKTHADDANVAISCGGLVVEPGDIVVTDEDGIVVVPRAAAPEVVERARQIEHREQSWRRMLAEGKTLDEIIDIEAMLANSGIVWE